MREKMKGMTLIQKIDYLWTYYKIWLLVPVVIGFFIYLGCTMYRTRNENVLVNAVVVGSTLQSTETLETEIKGYMNREGKNDVVTLQTNVPDDNMGQTSAVALSTMVGAGTVDVLVCPESVYRYLGGQQGGLLPMKEILGETEVQDTNLIKEDALFVADSGFLQEKLGVPYEEAYIIVVSNAPHKEGAAQFVQYVLDNL